jgi:hypothetical protein
VSPDITGTTQTDDNYFSPNSLTLRGDFVVIDVSNIDRIQNSILNEWIRNRYSKSGDFHRLPDRLQQPGEVSYTWKICMDACLKRQAKGKGTQKCVMMELSRNAGDWTWEAHQANQPCLNVRTSKGHHQCMKVINESTLWLLNPEEGDFDRQERFDRENHAKEALTAGQPEAGGVSLPSNMPLELPQLRRSQRYSVDDNIGGGDAQHDTVEFQGYRPSSPVDNLPQSHHDDPSDLPPPGSRRHSLGLRRSFSRRSIGSNISSLYDKASDKLNRMLSIRSSRGMGSTSSYPNITHHPTLLPRAPPDARTGLSRSGNDQSIPALQGARGTVPSHSSMPPHMPRATDFTHRPASVSASSQSTVVHPSGNHGRTPQVFTFPDPAQPLASTSGSQFAAQSHSSMGHSRTGSANTAASLAPRSHLGRIGEEATENVDVWSGQVIDAISQPPDDDISTRPASPNPPDDNISTTPAPLDPLNPDWRID